jgi:arylsulfatase A-like enzyme
MDAIRASGKADNTIVVFTSDNGPENLTYPVLKEHGHASQGLLRGAKRMLWEGGHRVPYLVWGPGRVPKGQIEKEVVCHTDIMATVASIVGTKLPNDVAEDSYNISAAWFGKSRSKPIREATVHHSMNNEYGPPNPNGGRTGTASNRTTNLESCSTSRRICARPRTSTRNIRSA